MKVLPFVELGQPDMGREVVFFPDRIELRGYWEGVPARLFFWNGEAAQLRDALTRFLESPRSGS